MTRDIHPLWSRPAVAATALTTAWGLVVATPEVRAAEAAETNVIAAVVVDEQPDRTVIRVETSSRPTFTVFKLSDPVRLFIDIVDGDVSAIAAATDVRNGVISRISAHQQVAGDATIGRLVIGFDQDASYDIRTEGTALLVIVDGAGRTRPDLRLQAAEAEAQRIEKALERERQLLAQLKAARLEEERLQRQAVLARGQEESLTQQVQAARAEAERLSELARIEADRMMKELEALRKKRSLEQEKAEALARAIEADTARKAALVEERKAAEKLKQATEQALEQEKARLAAIQAAKKRAEAERQAAVAAVEAARAREAAAARVSEAKARGESGKIRELSIELQRREEALAKANAVLLKHQKALEEAQLAQAQAEARLKKANDEKLQREAERRQAAEEALAMERARVKALQEALAEKDTVEAQRRAQLAGASERAQAQLAALERQLEAQRKAVVAAQEQTEVEQARIALLKDQLESEQASLERLRKERAGEEARVASLKQEVAGLEKARQAADEARVQAEAMQKGGETHNAEAARQAEEALKKVEEAERQAKEALAKAEAARREAARAEGRGDAASAAAVSRAQEAERRAQEAEAKAREAAAAEQRAREAAQREAAEAARRAAEAEQKLAAAEQQLARLAEGDVLAAQRAEAAERRAQAAEAKAQAAEAKAQAAEAKAQAAEEAHAEAARARAELAARPVVRDISFKDKGGTGELRVALTGAAQHEIVRHGGRRLELRLKSATIPAALERSLDTTELDGPVKLVSSFRAVDDPGTVRIVVDLREEAVDDVRVEGDALVWAFTPRAAIAKPAVAQAQTDPKQVPGRRTPPGVHTYPGAVAAQGGAVPGDAGTAARSIENRRRRAAQRQYTGKKINLTIKDADIQHVLTFLAKEGGVNIVASDKVRGKVTFHLENVPWDLALDMILKTQGYDYVREAGVIRVAPAADIQAEFEAELKKKTVISGLKPMVVRFITVNYADLSKLKEHIATVLSKSGTVSVDQATSTLIVKDIEEHVQAAEDIVRRLDVQLPQVLIEARIVEASTSFSQEFGVQWGGNFIMAPAFGNPTGLAFPSIVGVSGGADDATAPSSGVLASNPNFAVNLPAAAGAGAGGAIGLTLGSLGGAANLNLRLSAAEDSGTVKIVSAPKILTLDGQKAIIQQGISVPISVVSANGVNTQFFNADLKLEVLTNSSPDGNIRLDLDITKNEPDFGQVSATGAPAIQKKEAHTSLLVRDGETTVIGGIFTRNTGRSEARVPFFSKIPILGWFFKNTRETDNRTELLIFITPRIANRRASVVQGNGL